MKFKNKDVKLITYRLLKNMYANAASFDGFNLVIEAVALLYEEPDIAMTGEDGVYGKIAKGKSAMTTERAIRYLIKTLGASGNRKNIEKICGEGSVSKPFGGECFMTPRAFCKSIVNYINYEVTEEPQPSAAVTLACTTV